jgi:hypothetical protein
MVVDNGGWMAIYVGLVEHFEYLESIGRAIHTPPGWWLRGGSDMTGNRPGSSPARGDFGFYGLGWRGGFLRMTPKHWISDYRSLLAGKDSEAFNTGGGTVEIKHEDQRNPPSGRISAHTALSEFPRIAVATATGQWSARGKPQ